MSKFAMLPQKVGESHEGFNAVTTDLLNNIRKLRDSTSLLPDTMSHLFHWSFESMYPVFCIFGFYSTDLSVKHTCMNYVARSTYINSLTLKSRGER